MVHSPFRHSAHPEATVSAPRRGSNTCAKAEAGICVGPVGGGLVGKQKDKGDGFKIGDVAVWFIGGGGA